MDRLYFDTNVLLDHLLAREPFADDASQLWAMAERREVVGCISALSFNFVYYIIRHNAGERAGRRALAALRDVFETIAVDSQVINQAIDSGFKDFEDAVQHACAVRAKAAHIVTRDLAGFRPSSIPVIAPDVYLLDRG